MKTGKKWILLSAIAFIGMNGAVLAQSKNEKKLDETGSAYQTGIGIRGGWTSGISIKHFVSDKAAVEGILGSRWRGFSVTGLYELHKPNALGASRLSWEYGIGGRLGFYDGSYYRVWNDKVYYTGKRYTVVSLVGMLGMEYYFKEIPFTVGLDIMPYFDFVGRGDGFIDGSVSLRYVFK